MRKINKIINKHDKLTWSTAFLEVKLLAENPFTGWKIEYFPKVEGLLIQKRENIFIIYLVYSQRLHHWLVRESFLFQTVSRSNSQSELVSQLWLVIWRNASVGTPTH